MSCSLYVYARSARERERERDHGAHPSGSRSCYRDIVLSSRHAARNCVDTESTQCISSTVCVSYSRHVTSETSAAMTVPSNIRQLRKNSPHNRFPDKVVHDMTPCTHTHIHSRSTETDVNVFFCLAAFDSDQQQ